MAIFNSKLLNYQRVSENSHEGLLKWGILQPSPVSIRHEVGASSLVDFASSSFLGGTRPGPDIFARPGPDIVPSRGNKRPQEPLRVPKEFKDHLRTRANAPKRTQEPLRDSQDAPKRPAGRP